MSLPPYQRASTTWRYLYWQWTGTASEPGSGGSPLQSTVVHTGRSLEIAESARTPVKLVVRLRVLKQGATSADEEDLSMYSTDSERS